MTTLGHCGVSVSESGSYRWLANQLDQLINGNPFWNHIVLCHILPTPLSPSPVSINFGKACRVYVTTTDMELIVCTRKLCCVRMCTVNVFPSHGIADSSYMDWLTPLLQQQQIYVQVGQEAWKNRVVVPAVLVNCRPRATCTCIFKVLCVHTHVYMRISNP